MTGMLDLKVETSQQGMPEICAAADGSKLWPDIYVDGEDLDGAALDAKFDTADKAAAEAPDNANLRMAAAFAYAVARDYKCATASSPLFHFAMGAQGALRVLYGEAILTLEATT